MSQFNPPKQRGKAFEAAYKKGFAAGLAGEARESSPYVDKPRDKCTMAVSFSRGFVYAWQDGWATGDSQRLAEQEKHRWDRVGKMEGEA